jgi:hypothetical protein
MTWWQFCVVLLVATFCVSFLVSVWRNNKNDE